MARWFTYKTLDPLDPSSGNTTEVRIADDYVERLNKYRPVDWYNLKALAEVLDAPNRIYYGIRELTDGGWCYVGRPKEWTVRDKVTATFPDFLVFVVYLTDDFRVYSHRAEPADPGDILSPKNWEERYRKLIWKKNS